MNNKKRRKKLECESNPFLGAMFPARDCVNDDKIFLEDSNADVNVIIASDDDIIKTLKREVKKYENGEKCKGIRKLKKELHTDHNRIKRIGEKFFGEEKYKKVFGKQKSTEEEIIEAVEIESKKCDKGEKHKALITLAREFHTTPSRIKEIGKKHLGEEKFQRSWSDRKVTDIEIIRALKREVKKYENGEKCKGIRKLRKDLHTSYPRVIKLGKRVLGEEKYKKVFGKQKSTEEEIIEAVKREMKRYDNGQDYKGVRELAEELICSHHTLRKIVEKYYGEKKYQEVFGLGRIGRYRVRDMSSFAHVPLDFLSLEILALKGCSAVHGVIVESGHKPDLIIERGKGLFIKNIEDLQEVVYIPERTEKITVDYTFTLDTPTLLKKLFKGYHNRTSLFLNVLLREGKDFEGKIFTAQSFQRLIDGNNAEEFLLRLGYKKHIIEKILDNKENIKFINFEQYLEFLGLNNDTNLSLKEERIASDFRYIIELGLTIIDLKAINSDACFKKLIEISKKCAKLLGGKTPREKRVLSLSIDWL